MKIKDLTIDRCKDGCKVKIKYETSTFKTFISLKCKSYFWYEDYFVIYDGCYYIIYDTQANPLRLVQSDERFIAATPEFIVFAKLPKLNNQYIVHHYYPLNQTEKETMASSEQLAEIAIDLATDKYPLESIHWEWDDILYDSIEEYLDNYDISLVDNGVESNPITLCPDVRDGLNNIQRKLLYMLTKYKQAPSSYFLFKDNLRSYFIVKDVIEKLYSSKEKCNIIEDYITLWLGNKPLSSLEFEIYKHLAMMTKSEYVNHQLVDGGGYWGARNLEQYPPAHIMYTYVKLSEIAKLCLEDIEKNTVDFVRQYDSCELEPTALPSKFPTLLVNGSINFENNISKDNGTCMLPYNLGECCDAISAYIDNPDIDLDGIMQYVKGPDFPTGCVITNFNEVKDILETGRGGIEVRASVEIRDEKDCPQILVKNSVFPYSGNNRINDWITELMNSIDTAVKYRKIKGIKHIEQYWNWCGIETLMIYLEQGVDANVVLEELYKHTKMASHIFVDNTVMVDGVPQLLNFKQLIEHFVKHRLDVIYRKAEFDKNKLEKKANNLKRKMNKLDVINIEDIQNKLDNIAASIIQQNNIMTNTDERMSIIKQDLNEIKKRHKKHRRTLITA